MATCLPSRAAGHRSASQSTPRARGDESGTNGRSEGDSSSSKRGHLAVQVTDDRTGDDAHSAVTMEAVETGAGFRRRTGRRRMLPVRGCRLRFQKQRDCMRGSWRGFTHQAQGKLDGARERNRRRMGDRSQEAPADSHVWKMSDDEKRRFGEEWKKKVERQEMAGGDRVLCIQADVRRAPVLAKVEEHGTGSQDQGGHVQQAGRHGGRCGVVQSMQGPCMF